jgi:hypothetical protein
MSNYLDKSDAGSRLGATAPRVGLSKTGLVLFGALRLTLRAFYDEAS